MSSSVHSNGYLEGNSPNSSQLSSEGGGGGTAPDATLISRTQKQHTTQQVRGGQRRLRPTMGGLRELWTAIATSQPRVQIQISQGNAFVKLRELPTNLRRLIWRVCTLSYMLEAEAGCAAAATTTNTCTNAFKRYHNLGK